jgi:hypothetical protein
MASSLAAAALFAATNATLLRAPADPAAAAAAGAPLHLAREGLLAALLPAAVLAALAPRAPWRAGLLQARWDGAWAVRTLAACAVVFPLADPLLYHAWAPAAEVRPRPGALKSPRTAQS